MKLIINPCYTLYELFGLLLKKKNRPNLVNLNTIKLKPKVLHFKGLPSLLISKYFVHLFFIIIIYLIYFHPHVFEKERKTVSEAASIFQLYFPSFTHKIYYIITTLTLSLLN